MCLQQTDLGTGAKEQTQTPEDKTFVVSLFGARDDIKAHYTAERARICGATWEAFFKYAGASAEDVWRGVAEADRKLWSVSAVGGGLEMKQIYQLKHYLAFLQVSPAFYKKGASCRATLMKLATAGGY